MARVLIADGIAGNVEALTVRARAAGFDVATAFSGAQAVEFVESDAPDVVVLGAALAEPTAIELCGRLSGDVRLRSLPVFLHVDVPDDVSLVAALDAGAEDVVDSSMGPAVLAAKWLSAVRRKEEFDRLREMVERLDGAKRRAESASRYKSEFLAHVSHEIRTPLTSILGFAELLLDPETSTSNRTGWIQTIRSCGEHLVTVLNDVLDMTKIESGKLGIELLRVRPLDVVREVCQLLGPRAREKGLRFELEFDGVLPETIETDPTRLRQILVNLAGNAIKFTDEGSVTITCGMLDPADAATARLGFTVTDTGIGMSADEGACVFEPFQQAGSSVVRRFGGSGLGLAICRRLTELLGGEIGFESEPGVGSKFHVSISTGLLGDVRMLEPHEIEVTSVDPAPQKAQTVNRQLSGRVLLAEDVQSNQRLLAYYLRHAGLEVELADNGEVALSAFRAAVECGHAFDIVLMDMQMPRLDGYAATAALRADGFAGPVVALTAHALQGERRKCIDAGCDDFATKPIRREQLLDVVARALARARGESPMAPDGEVGEESRSGAACEPTRRPAQDPAAESALGTGESARGEPAGEPIYSGLLEQLGTGDPELVRMVACFVRDLPERVQCLERHLGGGDFEAIGRLAHQLKGAAGGYGFPQVGRLAGRIEILANEGSPIGPMRLIIEDLARVCSRLSPSVRIAARG